MWCDFTLGYDPLTAAEAGVRPGPVRAVGALMQLRLNTTRQMRKHVDSSGVFVNVNVTSSPRTSQYAQFPQGFITGFRLQI